MPVNRIAGNPEVGETTERSKKKALDYTGESRTAGKRPVFPQQMLHRSCNFTQVPYRFVLQFSSGAVQFEGKAELKKEISACGRLAPQL
jgi:hypothetical protein